MGDALRAFGWTESHFMHVEAGYYADFESGDDDAALHVFDLLGLKQGRVALCPFSGHPRRSCEIDFDGVESQPVAT